VTKNRRTEHGEEHGGREHGGEDSAIVRNSPASIARPSFALWTRSSAARVSRSMSTGDRIPPSAAARALHLGRR